MHLRVVRVVHPIVPQMLLPNRTDGVESYFRKPSPSSVIVPPPEIGRFGRTYCVITGASNVIGALSVPTMPAIVSAVYTLVLKAAFEVCCEYAQTIDVAEFQVADAHDRE